MTLGQDTRADIADLVLVNGRLWDGTHRPAATALLISGGRILEIGSDAQVTAAAGDRVRRVDLGGRRVIPGLIDSHIHMVRGGLRWRSIVRWNEVTSLAEALELVRSRAQEATLDEWVAVLGGWHPGQFEEARPPTREELDSAGSGRPVFVQRNYIEAFLNTRALEEAAFDEAARVDTVSGRVSGQSALAACNARLALPPHEEQVGGTKEMIGEFHRLGLTGAIDAAGFGMAPEMYRAASEVLLDGSTPFRLRLLAGPGFAGNEIEQLDRWLEVIAGAQESDFFRHLGFGEVALFAAHDMEGLAVKETRDQTERLAEVFEKLTKSGWPIHTHAILGSTIGTVLDAWELAGTLGAQPVSGSALAHAEFVSDRDLERIAELGLGLAVQNGMAFRGHDSASSWGADVVHSRPPLRKMINAGIPMGAGTDATVVSSYNPWVALGWMVTGRPMDGGPGLASAQTLTRDEALSLYTKGSAWLSGEDDNRGNLTAGSHADVVVLSDDFLTIDEGRLSSITSALTVVDGHVVHDDLPASSSS